MDQKSEQEGALVNLENRVNAAKKALTYCETAVLKKNIDVFSPAEAMLLGSRYVAYSLEYWFHLQDLGRLKIELDPSRRINFIAVEELRGEAEAALFKANHDGDYSGIKQFLTDYYKNDKDHVLRNGLNELAEKCPSIGPKFVPPKPAWMDPRFNGEGDGSEVEAA